MPSPESGERVPFLRWPQSSTPGGVGPQRLAGSDLGVQNRQWPPSLSNPDISWEAAPPVRKSQQAK